MTNHPETPLESWKEIGAYLQRDSTTARRWEKEEGLPVHRHSHNSRSSVYAYASEIDQWRAARKVVAEPPPPLPLWKMLLAPPRSLAFGATLALCLVMVGNGIRPQSASAQNQPITARQVWTTPEPLGQSSAGSLSADGRYLSFTSFQTGGKLAVRDLTNGTTRLLTNVTGAYTSAIAPDARQVAYLWAATPTDQEVRVISIDGGAPRTIFKASDQYMTPSGWTPDGKQLLAVHVLPDRTTRIVMLAVQDGAIRPLKSLAWQWPQPSISPDGRYVAYSAAADDKTEAQDIFVLATDGSSENAVIQNPSSDFAPRWSPDGSRLLFVSDRTGNPSLWSVPVENGKPSGAAELVKADLGRAMPLGMSRSGALYYVIPGGGTNVYTAELGPDMRAGRAPALAANRFVNSNIGPAWSPDGQQLAYYSARGTSITLVIQTEKTGEEREIPVRIPLDPLPIFGNASPKWFPDGRSVLVLASEPQRPFPAFYRIELATGKAELLDRPNQGIQAFTFTPDGRAIFYAGLGRLVRFDLETRQETELMKGVFFGLSASPDSKWVGYLVAPFSGTASSLGIIPAAGGEGREVFRDSVWADHNKWNALTWSPDGQYLVFVRARAALDAPAVLSRVAVTGGQPEQLGISLKGEIHSPQVHPDGRHIVFDGTNGVLSEVWALENFLPAAATGVK